MHNEQLNAFYRVDDDGSSIRMVPSDTILLELAPDGRVLRLDEQPR